MGYFISVLRDRIATFHSQGADSSVDGISINDLRKNLSTVNQFMEVACRKTAARYGIELEAALVTTIDPPGDVDDALASINTTQNQVAAAISQARADADQKLTMAEQAVQIARNMADADAAPILELGRTLSDMFAQGGQGALDSYLRNAMLPTVTLAGLQFPALLGGAFVVEEVFGVPGIGYETIRAVEAHDTAWLVSIALITAIVTTLALIASDLALGLLDPRMRDHGPTPQGRAT